MKIPSYFFKFDFIKIFLIFSYIVCWLSISTSFQDFLIFKEEVFYGKLNIQNLISFKSINFLSAFHRLFLVLKVNMFIWLLVFVNMILYDKFEVIILVVFKGHLLRLYHFVDVSSNFLFFKNFLFEKWVLFRSFGIKYNRLVDLFSFLASILHAS